MNWKIGDNCVIHVYGTNYGTGKFLKYKARIVNTKGNKYIVETNGMQAIRSASELYIQ